MAGTAIESVPAGLGYFREMQKLMEALGQTDVLFWPEESEGDEVFEHFWILKVSWDL